MGRGHPTPSRTYAFCLISLNRKRHKCIYKHRFSFGIYQCPPSYLQYSSDRIINFSQSII